jgi:hypothetical protein
MPKAYRNLIKARYSARGPKPLKLFPIRAKFLSASGKAQCLRWKSGAAASNFGKVPIARTITIVTKAENSARLSRARNLILLILIVTITDGGGDGNTASVPHRQ